MSRISPPIRDNMVNAEINDVERNIDRCATS